MSPWVSVGKRFESIMAVVAVALFLIGGFFLSRTAPREIRWFVWAFWAGFVFPFSFAGLLLGRWVRRRSAARPVQPAGMAEARPAKTRLLLYIFMAAITVPADRVWAKAGKWSLSRFLLWDFAILVLLIAIMEFMEWRKRRLSNI